MLRLERSHEGIVCGIDEAGRGPLAGPVMAACVHIPEGVMRKRFWTRVNDSKALSAADRESLFAEIKAHSAYGIATATCAEIDSLNIHHATLLAMKRAFESMCCDFGLAPHHALVDGKFGPALPCNTITVIGGDGLSRSIAAASILAKVTRDRHMAALHESYPHYDWRSNAGYGTPKHMAALAQHGVTPHHRTSYAPVRALLEKENAL